MKRISLFLIAFIMLSGLKILAQENNPDIELLKTKQKLLETELELLKKKLDDKNKAHDSLVLMQKRITELEKKVNAKNNIITYNQNLDSVVVKPYKNTWEFNFFRLFEGSIEVSYEKLISDKDAIDISFFGTYADEKGIGQRYVDDYYYSEDDEINGGSIFYEADKMYGGGIELKWKRYLLAGKMADKYSSWKGLYIAPSIMYRAVVFEGKSQKNYGYYYDDIYNLAQYERKDFTNTLNIGKLGFYLGNKFVAADIFAIDVYVGGAIRLSHYSKDIFDDYSNWVDLDYTGIMPVAGIKFGVVNP